MSTLALYYWHCCLLPSNVSAFIVSFLNFFGAGLTILPHFFPKPPYSSSHSGTPRVRHGDDDTRHEKTTTYTPNSNLHDTRRQDTKRATFEWATTSVLTNRVYECLTTWSSSLPSSSTNGHVVYIATTHLHLLGRMLWCAPVCFTALRVIFLHIVLLLLHLRRFFTHHVWYYVIQFFLFLGRMVNEMDEV